MKQLDLILCAVAVVIGIVGSWIVWAMRKNPEPAKAPQTIDVSVAQLPNPQPVWTTNLPGASGGAMGRSGRGGGKRGGGFAG
ncbi:MAG: hypothetical protein ABUL72_03545 [Armatimonadota bacterium]